MLFVARGQHGLGNHNAARGIHFIAHIDLLLPHRNGLNQIGIEGRQQRFELAVVLEGHFIALLVFKTICRIWAPSEAPVAAGRLIRRKVGRYILGEIER